LSFFRYEYDDHYFLTDPKEFIYEFFPLQPEWQLLSEPITLEDFEELPFVRSLFFRYQLAFPSQHMKSVMPTDQTGAVTYRAQIPPIRDPNVLMLRYKIVNWYRNVGSRKPVL
jgi:transglutaminase/protease-like cytokinesis protein 3